MHTLIKNKLLIVTFISTLIFAIHYAIPLYVTSTYFNIYFSASIVSAIYVISSLLGLLASLSIAKSLRRFHTYKFTAMLVVGEIVSVILFALTQNIYAIVIYYCIHFIFQTLLFICINIFVEALSKHANTGSIRGIFLTVFNIGILVSPVIAGFLLKFLSYRAVYIVSALVLLPFLYLLKEYLYHIKEPAYHSVNIFMAISKLLRDRNLRAVFFAEFIVQCFYVVMVIYSPLYLTAIGIPLTIYLTFILPIALLPLVLLPFELGHLADKKLGEKNMLVIGLIILALTTFACIVITSVDPLIWTLLLLTSRIGASLVETMAFTYFFRTIKKEDVSLNALFNNTFNLATVLIGGVGIFVGPYLAKQPQLMFIILGCGILWCTSYIIRMKTSHHHI